MIISLKELAEQIGAELTSGGSAEVCCVSPIAAAMAGDVTFIADKKHLRSLVDSSAAAVITSEKMDNIAMPQLIVGNVQKGLIAAIEVFAPALQRPQAGIDKTAVVADSAKISDTASVGPYCVIDAGVEIGANTVVSSFCRIGQNSVIGDNSRIDANVVIYHNCKIGSNVIIQANTTIGSTGFGYYFIDGTHRLIPHNGGVLIEDFVEIGANTCIDRAKFGQTVIGAGTKIDNLVQIAHNVQIGKCCLIAGKVGIAGSAVIGDGVVLAGGAGVGDNRRVGDGAVICANSIALSDVDAGSVVSGMPAVNLKVFQRTVIHSRRLPEYVKQIKELTKRIESLESSKDNKR